MEKIKELALKIWAWILGIWGKMDAFYAEKIGKLKFMSWCKSWMFYAICAFIVLLILILICRAIKKNKKRKVKFFVDGKVVSTVKAKFKKPIAFPEVPVKEGFDFVTWSLDKAGKKPYVKTVLDRKKKLELYAIFEPAKAKEPEVEQPVKVEAPAPVQPAPQPAPQYVVPQFIVPQFVVPNYVQSPFAQPYAPVPQPAPVQPAPAPVAEPAPAPVVEPAPAPAPQPAPQPAPIEYGPAYYYDEIRFAMLGYERSPQFKKLGVQRKQVIAEMFQKDQTVYLYLNVDPMVMAEKGFKVERFTESQFEIVPCKKAINSKEDLEEALALVKEAMTINNLVKSDISFMQRPVSDEASRRSGFAFFVKNENVATTAEDYYRLLRATVLSYQKKENVKIPENLLNRMILKIYKKDELVYVYLALDPSSENLANVSFDKNFMDTPAMLEIKSSEDFLKANELIDKLMARFGMMRNPAKAEISLDDKIDVNCGFGYRIKN